MEKKYYLHRISHEDNVSYSLLDKGYLSLGWSRFSKTSVMDEARKSEADFNNICEKQGEGKNRSRWNMWYFAQMKEGDVVVVPQYGGLFSAYLIKGPAKSISEYSDQLSDIRGKWDNARILWKDDLLYDEAGSRKIDLGFLIPVEMIIRNAKRSYVLPKFSSRMKIRTTSADITDIKDEVIKGIEACKNDKPDSLYEYAIQELAADLKKSISNMVSPDGFERLVKWYMKKCGASSVWIPAKNEPNKKDGADADIIAEFENLKHIVYIQAKKHEGTTDDWAVKQVSRYKEQNDDEGDPGYSYSSWVISTADNFSKSAMAEAALKGIRLIDGAEFAKMLVDAGLNDIDSAFE